MYFRSLNADFGVTVEGLLDEDSDSLFLGDQKTERLKRGPSRRAVIAL